MTDAEMDELLRLSNAATPGPYSLDANYLIGFPPKHRPTGESIGRLDDVPEPTRAYIVAACNAVPELVEMVRAAEARVAELEDALQDWVSWEADERPLMSIEEMVEKSRAALKGSQP